MSDEKMELAETKGLTLDAVIGTGGGTNDIVVQD
jgi:hypothetical protein